jgi:hypothetical protein
MRKLECHRRDVKLYGLGVADGGAKLRDVLPEAVAWPSGLPATPENLALTTAYRERGRQQGIALGRLA